MPLFLIEHNHTSEACPTRNPDMVRALRAHVTAENARSLGVTLLADWANEPDHHVVFVVDSETLEAAERFASPFVNVSSVKVTQGLTCEQVAKECLGE